MSKYYHGTKAKFTKFSKVGSGKHGPGFYFTPDKNEAAHFAKTLAGDGSNGEPIIYEVTLTFNNPFNTMSVEDAEVVAKSNGFKYKVPEFAGGLKEHFHHLRNQMKRKGLIETEADFNKLIKDAGFDCIKYDLMEHIIVFNPNQIKIVDVHEA